MKKILVILTGGTIGSKVDSNLINTDFSSSYRLIHMYNEKYDCDTEFEVIQPINILSENLTPKHWGILYNTLKSINFADYCGIIITHGSDTLSYTSAFIGIVFAKAPIPIVLTASNLALELPGSNGMDNFRSAVCFIKSGKTSGVYTIFQDCNKNNNIYLSTQITESDPYNDEFKSFSGEIFGKMVNERFVKNPKFDASCCQADNSSFKLCKLDLVFTNSIMIIRPYPGLNYNSIDLSSNPKAVLHYLYHSATACTAENNYSIIDFIRRCKLQGIDVYCASFKDKDAAMYATSKKIIDEGIIPLYNVSPEFAYAKLLILYNQ